MKEIVKPVLTWLLGLFNVGVYMDDGIDSLLMTLQYLELEEQANEIVHIYYTMQFFVWAKYAISFFLKKGCAIKVGSDSLHCPPRS